MRIHLDEIPESGLVLTFSGMENVLVDALNRIKIIQRGEIHPFLKGRISIDRVEDGALLTGTVTGSVELQCARCLTNYISDPEVNLRVLVAPRRSGAKAQTNEGDVDENTFFLEGVEFDPGDVILQELLLGLPMKPLCAEDCKGMCPRCGHLQNQCSCPENKPIDSRWAALKDLKSKMKSTNAEE